MPTLPVPTTSQGYILSQIRETDPSISPAGNLQAIPFATFDPSGGDITRQPSKNVSGGQPPANPAQDKSLIAVSATSALLLPHYNSLWEEVMCAPAVTGWSQTGTNISAAATGNKLSLATGTWPAGAAVGDIVYVTGFAPPSGGNGSFIAEVTAKSGTDLSLSTNRKTLITEAAGASITVKLVSRYRLGESFLSSTWQAKHNVTGRGYILRDFSFDTLSVKWSHGSSTSVPEMSWSGSGISRENFGGGAAGTVLANAIDPVLTPYNELDCNENFGAKLLSGGGGGLFFGGALFDVRVQEYDVTITRKRGQSSGGGTLGPISLYINDRFDLKVSLKIAADCNAAWGLLDAASDPTTVASLGHAWRDNGGKLEYWMMPQLDPSKGKPPGLAQTGQSILEFEWMGHADSLRSMFERTVLN
jgi:hypothetical protein